MESPAQSKSPNRTKQIKIEFLFATEMEKNHQSFGRRPTGSDYLSIINPFAGTISVGMVFYANILFRPLRTKRSILIRKSGLLEWCRVKPTRWNQSRDEQTWLGTNPGKLQSSRMCKLQRLIVPKLRPWLVVIGLRGLNRQSLNGWFCLLWFRMHRNHRNHRPIIISFDNCPRLSSDAEPFCVFLDSNFEMPSNRSN